MMTCSVVVTGSYQLFIDAPYQVQEGASFDIYVFYYNGSVNISADGVLVTFQYASGQQHGYTVNGLVSFLAPLINESSETATLLAEKAGFLSATTEIHILNQQPPENQLQISAPLSVQEGENFPVYVIDTNELPINNALVTFLYPGGQQQHSTLNGTTWFTAPVYNESQGNATSGTLLAEKEGYSSASVGITILHASPNLQLVITAPSQVLEGSQFEITVRADSTPIQGVAVDFSNGHYVTNSYGVAILTAPLVSNTTSFSITASKNGYLPAQVWISVVDSSSGPAQLQISVPSQVKEGTSFDVLITVNGNTIQNALVVFDDKTYTSNALGKVTLTAPSVDETKGLTITASKSGYLSAMVTIIVTNTVPQLSIDAPSSITEGMPFEVTVTVVTLPVDNAAILFNNKTYHTNTSGQVLLTAPLVDYSTDYTLTALKDGYLSAISTIDVLNEENITGRIYGKVTSGGVPVVNAKISVQLFTQESIIANQCTFTQADGTYSLYVQPSISTIQVEKQGYVPYLQSQISIYPGQELLLNITLEALSAPPPLTISDEKVAADYTIQSIINEGYVGAKITIMSLAETSEPQVEYYSTALSIQIDHQLNRISYTVGASNITAGTFVFLFIDKNVFADTTIKIVYDNQELDKMPLSQFLHPQSLTEPAYVLLSTKEGNYIGVYFPHFSEHTVIITPEKVIEALGGITAIIIYVTALVLVALLYIVPIFYLDRKK